MPITSAETDLNYNSKKAFLPGHAQIATRSDLLQLLSLKYLMIARFPKAGRGP